MLSVSHGCLQVFLAMPSACPVAPDGTKRTVPTGADDRGAVTMYTSDDNAETFKQVGGRTCTSRQAASTDTVKGICCLLVLVMSIRLAGAKTFQHDQLRMSMGNRSLLRLIVPCIRHASQ